MRFGGPFVHRHLANNNLNLPPKLEAVRLRLGNRQAPA